MDKPAHTPGPVWSFRYYMDPVGDHGDNFHLFNGPEGDQGSTILEGSFTFPGTHSEALKFARLIAAAPQLLAACEYQENIMSANCSPEEAIATVRQMRREAIAKALGQETTP